MKKKIKELVKRAGIHKEDLIRMYWDFIECDLDADSAAECCEPILEWWLHQDSLGLPYNEVIL